MKKSPRIVKFLFLIIVLSFCAIRSNAQTVFYVNDKIRVIAGTELFINGYVQTDTNTLYDNGGLLIITDSIVNYSNKLFESSSYGKLDGQSDDGGATLDSLKLAIGQVIFLDDTLSRIAAYAPILFNDLILNNPAGVSLANGDTIAALGGLEFQQGLFDLNGHVAKMYFYGNGSRQPRTSGVLVNENNASRIVDSSGTGSVAMVKNLADMPQGCVLPLSALLHRSCCTKAGRGRDSLCAAGGLCI